MMAVYLSQKFRMLLSLRMQHFLKKLGQAHFQRNSETQIPTLRNSYYSKVELNTNKINKVPFHALREKECWNVSFTASWCGNKEAGTKVIFFEKNRA